MRAKPITEQQGCGPRARIVALLLTVGALSIAVTPALAAEPVDVGGAYLVDEAGVLGADQARVEAALDEAFTRVGAPLLVVIVDTFDNPANGAEWADASAIASGLGERDALLAIAVQDRAFGLSPGSEFPISDAELATAESEALIPALREDRWADGIVAYADRLGAADGGGVPILPIAVGAIIVIVIVLVLVARARRRGTPSHANPEAQSTADLDQTASSRLVQLDDAVRTSEQELGFAQAQFGEESTAGFRDALARAESLVAEAFAARREADAPEKGDSDEQRRALLLTIIARCDEADALLEAQEDTFDALRDVEQDLPAALASVRADLATAAGTVQTESATVAQLSSDYSADEVSAVADAPEQLPRLVELAKSELAEAEAALTRGTSTEAAMEVRSAQLALAQITQTATAVERLSGELRDARSALAEQRSELESRLASARSAILSAAEYIAAHRGGVDARARADLAEAKAQLEVAVAGRDTEPAASLTAAQRAHELARQSLDSAQADVRGALGSQGAIGGLVSGGGSGSGSGGALIGGLLGGLLGGGGTTRPRFGSSGGSATSRRSTSSGRPSRPSRPRATTRSTRTSSRRSGRSRGGRF